MGYQDTGRGQKGSITAEQIENGQIKLRHLDPSLFSEFRQINLHNHSGVKSRKINLKDVTGNFTKDGFYMYSSDATKKYKVTIDSTTGTFVLTEV